MNTSKEWAKLPVDRKIALILLAVVITAGIFQLFL